MPDTVLLDTHALLWWQAGSGRLSRRALAAIRGATCQISPITCWEVATLVTKGRIALDRPVARWVADLVATEVEVVDLTPSIAAAAGSLVDFHGDPADRLIYATAAARRIPPW
jgi:PIN domain nuclease of toxin-antitoxin system